MKQLSALDATFLHLESAAMPMHVGSAHVFERPAGVTDAFVDRLRQHMAQRLPLAPVLRQRLWWMPLNLSNPAWVDAEVDLKQHIVAHKLPASAKKGDGLAELYQLVGRLHGQLLDRSRPLWRMNVIEGLAPSPVGRQRVAVYTQFHHAAVDGQAAVALGQVILDLSADAPAPELRPSQRKKVFKLGALDMLRGAIVQEASQVLRIVRGLPHTANVLVDAAGQALQLGPLRPAGTPKVGNLGLAPRTLFNVNVQPGRHFAGLSLPLAAMKAQAKAQGGTLNDLVLYLCSTGLRQYLATHGGVPRKSLVAAVPITLRAKGDTSASNQASMSLVSLGTHLGDATKRLAHVMAATAAMKATVGSLREVLPTDLPGIGVPWLSGALAGLYGRAKVAERLPPLANVVISNVPGPPVPLFMAGAHMLCNLPTSIVAHGMALNITVQSYDQQMDFGLVADAHAVPDLPALTLAIGRAFAALRGDAPPELPTNAPVKAPVKAPAKTSAKASAKAPAKTSAKTSAKATAKKPAKKLAKKLVSQGVKPSAKPAVNATAKSAAKPLGQTAGPASPSPRSRFLSK